MSQQFQNPEKISKRTDARSLLKVRTLDFSKFVSININFNQNQAQLRCDICDFKTDSNSKLEEHFKLRVKQTKTVFKCDTCEFKSCTAYGLIFHRSKVHRVTKLAQKYKCGYCLKKFTTLSHFRTHILSKHLGEEGDHKCDICDFKTFDICYFRKHMKNHEPL